VLREALAVNPKLKIIASPWSPPGWMKTSGSMIGGTLLPSSFTPLARYFVRFVQSYEAAGAPIFAITPQNEPRNIPADYPGMGMTAEEQPVFIREHLGPALRAAHLKTKIMAFDHNWVPRRSNYRPLEITSDAHPTVDFTALAHASNFVAPGALRIDSTSSEESPLKHVAFRNSDGSIVLLVLNPSESAITFGIVWQSQYATYMLQPGAVVTFHWPPISRTRH